MSIEQKKADPQPWVFVINRAAPEESEQIVICHSREQVELHGLEIQIADSSPHACQAPEFLEACAGA